MTTQGTQPLGSIKEIVFLTILVLFMLWLLNPYTKNNTDVLPDKYYELGLACLNDFERNTYKSSHKLTNTYAKKVSKFKDMILIRVQNLQNLEQVKVECIYDSGNLLFLSVNDLRLEL